jgi:DNA repair exonuclease SbcCD ATPase subunit
MTDNKKKTYILEWENAELKNGTTPYEKFKIVAGEEEGNLLFYSTLFTDVFKFKKGDIYRLSMVGNFAKDGEIIQKIDGEGQKIEEIFQKITPSLLIKDLWGERKKTDEKLNLSEEDLKKKKEDVDKANQKFSDSEKLVSQLREQINNLQSEKEKNVKEISSLKVELQNKGKDVENANQVLASTKKELSDLQVKFSEIQFEKTKIENERMTPERQKHLLQEQENLKNELETEKREKQNFINQLEEIDDRSWKENIEEKLEEEKNKLSQSKVSISSKLESGQQVFLDTLLVIQEQFDNLIFEGVDYRICSPMKNQLKQTKDKLINENKKLSPDEIESLCVTQTEIIKLETQQKQWDKLEKMQKQEQQSEAYVEVNPR